MRVGARGAALLVVLAGVTGVPAPSSGQEAPDPVRIHYGDTAVVGQGVIRTWIELGPDGAPHALGVTLPERRSIEPGPVEARPAPRYMPAGHIPVPELGLYSFAEMGVHWVSPDAAELNGHTFDQTLIYGSIGERTIFVEPMFTQAFLETRPDLEAPVPLPAAVHKSGYYPTRYVIQYQAEGGTYRIALEGFRWRVVD